MPSLDTLRSTMAPEAGQGEREMGNNQERMIKVLKETLFEKYPAMLRLKVPDPCWLVESKTGVEIFVTKFDTSRIKRTRLVYSERELE
ncbi:hypothetical protein PoB_004008900 [Plakobranchus ocellatus]|uniref:Uncharacterized protein n=1 Tax=Plakobranchus ocellatus TaxID=259542 RepID=A0AAV4B4H3_9GAST|nr:hypothetical protein PoB_004008900 [Plakobranchus ocellatus]